MIPVFPLLLNVFFFVPLAIATTGTICYILALLFIVCPPNYTVGSIGDRLRLIVSIVGPVTMPESGSFITAEMQVRIDTIHRHKVRWIPFPQTSKAIPGDANPCRPFPINTTFLSNSSQDNNPKQINIRPVPTDPQRNWGY